MTVHEASRLRLHRLSETNLYVPFIVVMYAFSSMSGVFVSKACLSAYNFSFPTVLLLFQLGFSVVTFNVLRMGKLHVQPIVSLRHLRLLLVPAALLLMNVLVGLYALRLVNIPMFSAFRRLCSINVMLLEWIVLRKTESRRVICSVLFMVFGSFIAAMGDVTFAQRGYLLVFLNNMITAGNLVFIKKSQEVTKLGALSLYYYVSLLAFPMCLAVTVTSGELNDALRMIGSRPELQTPGFALAMALSATSAFMINYFTNQCTAVTSALTTAITGQTKNVLQTALGIFTWGYQVTALNLFGLFLALLGSAVFGRCKYLDRLESEGVAQAAASHATATPKAKPGQRFNRSASLRSDLDGTSPKGSRSKEQARESDASVALPEVTIRLGNPFNPSSAERTRSLLSSVLRLFSGGRPPVAKTATV